ncbi:MAG: hypothetical protein MEQ07_05185 [Aquimonas sp.]|nr:hypothetical protein [Aquimonas sp.]
MVERDVTRPVSAQLMGFSFGQHHSLPSAVRVFAAGEGDIEPGLSLAGAQVVGRYALSPAVGGWQALEIPVAGLARIWLSVTGLAPDAVADIDVEAPMGGMSFGASPLQRSLFSTPGALGVEVKHSAFGVRRSSAIDPLESQTPGTENALRA